MSHFNPGLISAYNSLTDKHLAGYFNNTRIRRHLQRVGLITRSGRIVPDKEYRHKLIQRAHQRHIRECLAQAIFHRVLEMERVHQIEIKRKLEEFARRERVHKMKVERSKRYEEDVIHILSPRPPTCPRGARRQHSGPEGEHSETSESPGSSRPNTAPGKMQRPVRLRPIHSNSTTASQKRRSLHRHQESSNETDQPFNCTMAKEPRMHLTTMEFSRGISPYCLPIINNFVTPVPPSTKRKDRGSKVNTSIFRGRRLRPTTAPGGADATESPMLRTSVQQSQVRVHMVFFGKSVHLSHDLIDMRDEVKVFQQHCGGENLCVYKGRLHEGESFCFLSRRHRGFPFSLTFFLNGLQVERVSSCCEFKHRKGSRLGGRHGHFGLSSVEGASPCYKCIIAMGLDKKPSPPPKRVKEDFGREATMSCPTETPKDTPEMEKDNTGKDPASHPEPDTSQVQEMENEVKGDRPPEVGKPQDDYEEDFEADDEGPAEDAEVDERKSPSPSIEKERETEEREASDSDNDVKDEDRSSHSSSSSSESDREAETEDTKEDQTIEESKEPEEEVVNRNESPIPLAEEDKPDSEDAAATESCLPNAPQTSTPAGKDSETQDSPGENTGWTDIQVLDTSFPSGNKGKGDEGNSGAKSGLQAQKQEDCSPQVEESERAKSEQEKLAEAILRETPCSSEPQQSDTSTKVEEDLTKKEYQQDNRDAVPEKSVTFTMQPQTLSEEVNHEESAAIAFTMQPQTLSEEVNYEESAAIAAEAATNQGETTSEMKEQEKETEAGPCESINTASDRVAKAEKAESETNKTEGIAEKDKSEDGDAKDASLSPDSEEKMGGLEAEELQADEPATPSDVGATEATKTPETREENGKEEEVVAEANVQPDETEQFSESGKRNEPLPSEMKAMTDETAAPDKTEAQAVAVSEMNEIKVSSSEKLGAVSVEEAHESDMEKSGGKGEVVAGGSEAVEILSGSSERRGETAVDAEKAAEAIDVKILNKPTTAADEEEAVEEASPVDASTEDGELPESVKGNQMNDTGEEETERSLKTDGEEDEMEKRKPEDTGSGDKVITQIEKMEKENSGKDEEEICKSNAENTMTAEENTTTRNEDGGEARLEAKEDQSEGKFEKGDKIIYEDKIEETEKLDRDDEDGKIGDGEGVKNEADEKESEEKVTATDETIEDVERSHTAENQLTKTENKGAENEMVKQSIEKIVGLDDALDHKSVDQVSGAIAEEIKGNATEATDVHGESQKEGNSEKEDTDAENGVIDREQRKDQGDEEKVDTQDTKDNMEPEEKSTVVQTEVEVLSRAEVGQTSDDHEETMDGREDDGLDQVPSTDKREKESETGNDNVYSQHDLQQVDSVLEVKEKAIVEDKLDEISQEAKETKQHPDKKEDKHSDIENEANGETEDRNSDLKQENNNVENNIKELTAVYQAPFSEPTAVSFDSAADIVDKAIEKSITLSESKINKLPNRDENTAADGEDTEEASKPSEEGGSVVLNPQAESLQLTHNVAAHAKGNSASSKEAHILEETIETEPHAITPEVLEREDNRDLVTNWVTLHQTSKFFEKFVEPLDDLKASTLDHAARVTSSETKEEEEPRTTPSESESPVKMSEMPKHEAGVDASTDSIAKEVEPTRNDDNEPDNNTKVESTQSELRGNRSNGNNPGESETTGDKMEVSEETEVKAINLIKETEQNGNEPMALPVRQDATHSGEHKDTAGPFEEDKDQDASTKRETEQTDSSTTEVESTAGTHHPFELVRPERATEDQKEEKATKDDPEIKEKQTTAEETKDLPSLSDTEGHQEHVDSTERLYHSDDMKAGEHEDTKEEHDGIEVTEVIDFTTTSKSEDGRYGDSQSEQIQSKSSDGGLSGSNKDVQLIEDIKHTLSKDRLSTFSMDETSLFGRNSYPLLTTTRTESSY
ncbi:glutamate-rich protein 3 [Lampris incognitus]|uniref:glutamate-rich protein 3 n=1 Tax=Lampris incognitus TaxID=2546036 RepID=UPI0024B61A4B|nr:glutamate-rich protein 3 [Lampris incognitus]